MPRMTVGKGVWVGKFLKLLDHFQKHFLNILLKFTLAL